MIRREFLARALGAAFASMTARAASARASAMHDMADMSDMSGMGNMRNMPGMTMGAGPTALAPVDALPAGAPLPPLRVLANESREPGLFRATLTAEPARHTLLAGKPTTFWQYNPVQPGPLVGPLIDVREGDTVEIRFENRLAQPSTIHWHGLPVPPDQDGNPADPVAPGASRIYRFTLPRGSAGTYWYHPHPHRLSAGQVFRGLAGPIVVRAADDPLAAWPERHLFFTDLKLGADGDIPANDTMDWMNGREGQFVLVNGARRPRLLVTRDERWRLWNGCNARYLKLTLGPGHRFTQVGTDGGLFETPRAGLSELLLAPGERAEIVVAVGAVPARAHLGAASYDRHKMAMAHGSSLPPDPALMLADVRFIPDADALGPRLPASLRAVPPLGAPVARKSVVFTEAMDMTDLHGHSNGNNTATSGMPRGMRFMINGRTFDSAGASLTSRRGEVERWSIENRTDMDHPFHLHGTQFQVIERELDGRTTPEPWRAWRDTVNLQPGETVRILTVQRETGERMFHCHILEHEDLGMMATLRVI